MESALTETDFLSAIKNLKNGKSPGPDGFSSRFYKTFTHQLAPLLAKAFNAIDGNLTPSSTLLQAQIVVIPKPGKDPSLCPNYRPISLLNIDLKLYAKILANRLSPLLPNTIHKDQVGFVPGREARDNTTKTIHLMTYIQRNHIPTCLLSCDAEKAFDRVSWPFLSATLSQLGLGPKMLARIMFLYSKPSATVLVNGTQSENFTITNGTRQGCPLSPLLFALVIEHLAQAIRANPNIHGVETPSSHCKLSLYADDLLLYVTQPHITIPSILAEIERFGSFSNYKLNITKTEALNLSLSQSILASLKTNFSFQWQTSSISYLGTAIPKRPSEIYALNFSPLLTKLRRLTDTRMDLPLSWFGRMNVLKMDILPKLLYLYQALPIVLPAAFFCTLRSMAIKFVWRGSHPRLKHKLLCSPSAKGGTDLPDFELYHTSTVISRILEWFPRPMVKASTLVEQDLSTIDLRALLWGYGQTHKNLTELSPLTRDALIIWYRKREIYSLTSEPSPLTPLFDNPAFPEGNSVLNIDDYDRTSWPTARQFVHNTLGTYATDRVILSPKISWLTRLHLDTFCKQLHNSKQIHRPLTGFEQLCTLPETPRHTLSLIYQLVLGNIYTSLPKYTKIWSGELGREMTEAEWEKAFLFTNKSSISSYTREKNYKLMSRWYRVPTSLKVMYPLASDICWRCNSAKGTYIHIWWECDVLFPFWTHIFQIYTEIYDKPLTPSPAIALLSILPGTIKSQKHNLLKFFLSVGRQLIPRHWKTTTPPSLMEWVNEMNNAMHMEKMHAEVLDTQSKFSFIWRHYSASDKLKHRLSAANGT